MCKRSIDLSNLHSAERKELILVTVLEGDGTRRNRYREVTYVVDPSKGKYSTTIIGELYDNYNNN